MRPVIVAWPVGFCQPSHTGLAGLCDNKGKSAGMIVVWVYLTAGTSVASCSNARLSGFWQLNPICANSRPTEITLS